MLSIILQCTKIKSPAKIRKNRTFGQQHFKQCIFLQKFANKYTSNEMSMFRETPTGMMNSYMRITYLPCLPAGRCQEGSRQACVSTNFSK
jgi:hypothetical protein